MIGMIWSVALRNFCYELERDVDALVKIDGVIRTVAAAPNCHCSVRTELVAQLGPRCKIWKVVRLLEHTIR